MTPVWVTFEFKRDFFGIFLVSTRGESCQGRWYSNWRCVFTLPKEIFKWNAFHWVNDVIFGRNGLCRKGIENSSPSVKIYFRPNPPTLSVKNSNFFSVYTFASARAKSCDSIERKEFVIFFLGLFLDISAGIVARNLIFLGWSFLLFDFPPWSELWLTVIELNELSRALKQ